GIGACQSPTEDEGFEHKKTSEGRGGYMWADTSAYPPSRADRYYTTSQGRRQTGRGQRNPDQMSEQSAASAWHYAGLPWMDRTSGKVGIEINQYQESLSFAFDPFEFPHISHTFPLAVCTRSRSDTEKCSSASNA